MKLGFIMTYNEVNWIEYAINQALKICDEIIICEGSQFTAFSDIPERSYDGTLDVISDKANEYPDIIKLQETVRIHQNYRENQCANFNRAVDMCKTGDYFIPLDVDEYYSDIFIERINILTSSEYNVDYVKAVGDCYGFSFQWRLIFKNQLYWEKDVLFKVEDMFHFVPSHKPSHIGHTRYTSLENSVFHYTWVRPGDRIRIRMKTSGFYPNMPQWFEDNWYKIKLTEDLQQPAHSGETFSLAKYTGNHPSILNNHPWRHIEDVRKIA